MIRLFLFDTGSNPDVVISHHHGDHTGGLITLRREPKKNNSHGMSRTHVATSIYLLVGRRTGLEATWHLRSALGLTRKSAPARSVASSSKVGS